MVSYHDCVKMVDLWEKLHIVDHTQKCNIANKLYCLKYEVTYGKKVYE